MLSGNDMVSAEIDGQIDDDLIDKLLLEQRERERNRRWWKMESRQG